MIETTLTVEGDSDNIVYVMDETDLRHSLIIGELKAMLEYPLS